MELPHTARLSVCWLFFFLLLGAFISTLVQTRQTSLYSINVVAMNIIHNATLYTKCVYIMVIV